MPVKRGLLAGSSWLCGRRQPRQSGRGARSPGDEQSRAADARARPGPAAAASATTSRLCCSRLASPAAVPERYSPLRRRVGVQHPGALHPWPHRVPAAAQRLFLHATSTPLDPFLNPKHENNLFLWKISSPLKI